MKTQCPTCGQPTYYPRKDAELEWLECDSCGHKAIPFRPLHVKRKVAFDGPESKIPEGFEKCEPPKGKK